MSLREKFLKDFISIANNFSDNISIYYASDNKNALGITYYELNKVSSELSLYFSKHFGRNCQYVAVSISDYFYLPCIILAIWKSGYCFAGVGTQYTKKNNLQFLDFLAIKYVICDTADCYDGEYLTEFYINERRYFIFDRKTKRVELSNLNCICYGIMTSGSTGEPKMIQVPWSCVLPNAVELSQEFQVASQDCIFQGSPYSFDPFFIELFITLLTGCSLMIVSNTLKLSPSKLLQILFGAHKKNLEFSYSTCKENKNYFHVNTLQTAGKNITILQMTPSVFRRWNDKEIQEHIISKDTTLRILVLGGEKFPIEVLKLKCNNNKTRIFNIYGITEVSCWAFLNEITNYNNKISIGKPLNNIVYKITENDELEIGSDSRYCFVNKEEISEFGNVVFRKTGDIVELVDEKIYFLGRNNQIVKKYGMKINLSNIELFFLNKNPTIKECFAIFNEDNLKLGLFYVPVANKQTNVNYELKTVEFFQNCYTIPEGVLKDIEKPDHFIEMTKTPLNPHGKCNRWELLQFLKSIKMKKCDESVKNKFKHLWAEILGTTHVNLFLASFKELGGNSVLGLKLLTKLQDEGFNIPQNFITVLLGDKGYNECLECLLQDESEAPNKKFKVDSEPENVELSIRWKFDLEKCVDATATVFNYQGEERIVIGSHSSKLSCINPNSGWHIWTTFLGDRIESGFKATKDGSKGFIGCYDRYVYCISSSDGTVIWKFKTGDVVKSTPCLSTDEKVVYVGSYDTNLYCLSVDDGRPKTTLKLSNGGIFSSGIITNTSFYIATLDGTCIALDQDTNKLKWKITLESPVFASPCLLSNQNEILFIEVLGNVHCFNALTGEKVWTYKATGNIYSSPIVEELNGVNHILFGCHDAHLYCLRYEKEPELKWKQHLDSSVFAKPSVVSPHSSVCAATTKGYVYLCHFHSGAIQTRVKLGGEVFSSPVYNNRLLFIGCRDNYVYGIYVLNIEK